MSYGPNQYTSVAPYLLVDDARKSIDFLIEVFSAERLRMIEGENGRLRHAEIRIDDTVVMLADSMAGWPAVPAHVHVCVADVVATFRRAISAGAIAVQDPIKRDDPDKRGGFNDASGTTWWLTQQIDPT